MVKEITLKNFGKEVQKSKKPVIIDFWAAWCSPCKLIAPVIEELSGELSDISFGKVNVDDERGLAEKYEVMSIPTLILFEKGKEKARHIGAAGKAALMEFLGK